MKGSRVKALLCGLGVLLLVQASAGQADQPVSATRAPQGLGPQSAAPEQPAPDTPDRNDTQQAAPADPAAATASDVAQEEVLPDQVGKPRGPKVTVSGLAPIDPSAAGLIDQASGGFASTLWSGSPRTAIVTRISQLPAAPTSPAMQGLLRRVLLSSASAPAGETPPDEPGMLAQRLSKLIEGGRTNEAAMLGARSPRDDAFARKAWAEALLLQARDSDACGDETALRESSSEQFWIELRAYCYIIGNNSAAAQLTLDVMRERAISDDTFFALASALTDGTTAKVAAISKPAGVHLALLSHAGVAPPASLAAWLPASGYFQQSQDPALRLVAIERSAAAGLVAPAQLAEAYAKEEFTPDQYDDPDAWAPKLTAARTNALYYQLISRRPNPAAKAAAYAEALERADAQNRFALFAQMSRGLSRQIPAVAETAWLAPHVIRVLLYNGDAKQAAAWLALMSSPTDAAVVNAIRIHAAVAYPSAENQALMPPALIWLGQNGNTATGAKPGVTARALREVPILDALGYVIPPEAQWAMAPAGGAATGVTAEALSSLTRAVQQRRVGEVVLNALVALGTAGPARSSTQVVARVVDVLTAIGMRDEARAIATEALLGASARITK
jgi:hypothetical protein